MREELKESTISQNRYELYYYNGTEETLVTDSLAYGSLTASAADKAVAVIEVRDEASASKVKISEIEYAYEAESRVREMLNTGTQYYVVSGSTMVPMETDDPQSFRMDDAGETIYYVDNVSRGGGHRRPVQGDLRRQRPGHPRGVRSGRVHLQPLPV